MLRSLDKLGMTAGGGLESALIRPWDKPAGGGASYPILYILQHV